MAVAMDGVRRKLKYDAEEGVLEVDSLPELKSLLFLNRVSVSSRDGGIPIESECTNMAGQYASKGPGITGMIRVHQFVDDPQRVSQTPCILI